MKCANPTMGYRELVKEVGLPWSHTTLMNRIKEYCAGSKQYEFQGTNIIEIKVDFLGEKVEESADSPNLLNSQRTEPVPF